MFYKNKDVFNLISTRTSIHWYKNSEFPTYKKQLLQTSFYKFTPLHICFAR